MPPLGDKRGLEAQDELHGPRGPCDPIIAALLVGAAEGIGLIIIVRHRITLSASSH